MMLTIREAQQRTGLSDLTIRRAILAGTVEHTMQDGKYLIPEEELSKLPSPRGAGLRKKVEVPQGSPFSLSESDQVQMEKYKTVQMLAQLLA